MTLTYGNKVLVRKIGGCWVLGTYSSTHKGKYTLVGKFGVYYDEIKRI